jgi:hypothetical protein
MTEAERIAAWAETQTEDAEPPAKRPQGRTGHLRHEEKQAIRLAYLEFGGRVTRVALATQFGVNRETVAECIKGPDFEALQLQFEKELRATAFDRLKAKVPAAADAWCDSIDVAASRGDHKPARDLLLHTKVIEPVQKTDGEGIIINIGAGSGEVKIGILSPLAQSADDE